MRASYTKPNSHTQQAARATRSAIADICRRAGISRDEYTALLFETGCRWAEANVFPASLRRAYLTDEARGYWAWWIGVYTDDDRELLDIDVPLSGHRYAELKALLTTENEQQDAH